MLFNPASHRSCYTCSGFGERRGEHVWCAKYGFMKAIPESGCSGWASEPGVDSDEKLPARPAELPLDDDSDQAS